MPKLNPLPTRVISDIEELRPAIKDSVDWQRSLMQIRGLADTERRMIEDVLVNLRLALIIIDRMRGREWDVVNDGKENETAESPKS